MGGCIDGLGWAAINVSKLQFPAGYVLPYYISASVMLITSVLALLLPKRK